MNHTPRIHKVINCFKDAWNNNDSGTLYNYLTNDIVCLHPAVHIGFVKMIKGNHRGYFVVLKFWESIFKNFNAEVEEVEVGNVEALSNGYEVQCIGHYPHMKLSGNFTVTFNEDFLIRRIEFTDIMNYRVTQKKSSLGLGWSYIKGRLKK